MLDRHYEPITQHNKIFKQRVHSDLDLGLFPVNKIYVPAGIQLKAFFDTLAQTNRKVIRKYMVFM